MPRLLYRVISESFSSELQNKVADSIRGATVALALDGWTKWSHEKMINFVILWKGKAIFWNTIPSHYGKSARTLMTLTKLAIQQIESRWVSVMSV